MSTKNFRPTTAAEISADLRELEEPLPVSATEWHRNAQETDIRCARQALATVEAGGCALRGQNEDGLWYLFAPTEDELAEELLRAEGLPVTEEVRSRMLHDEIPNFGRTDESGDPLWDQAAAAQYDFDLVSAAAELIEEVFGRKAEVELWETGLEVVKVLPAQVDWEAGQRLGFEDGRAYRRATEMDAEDACEVVLDLSHRTTFVVREAAAQEDRRKAARAAQQAALLAEFAAESERERETGQAAAVYVHQLPRATEDGLVGGPEQQLVRTSEGRWSPGEPVYVHEAADYRGSGCGISWWETEDIGCRRFPDAAAALAYVREQLQEARQRGLEVDVDPGETGFYAHNPTPPAEE